MTGLMELRPRQAIKFGECQVIDSGQRFWKNKKEKNAQNIIA